jgi:hypothetical protein
MCESVSSALQNSRRVGSPVVANRNEKTGIGVPGLSDRLREIAADYAVERPNVARLIVRVARLADADAI